MKPRAEAKKPAPASPQQSTAAAPDPPSVEIPSIGVAATMIPLGVTEDGRLEVPTDFQTPGWWVGGPEPGETGAAVIVGHVDSTAGPAIFYRLPELQPGDPVWVTNESGKRFRFLVDGTEQVPKTGFPTRKVYGRTPGPTIRLVTCSGDFDSSTGHYTSNLIVYASLA